METAPMETAPQPSSPLLRLALREDARWSPGPAARSVLPTAIAPFHFLTQSQLSSFCSCLCA